MATPLRILYLEDQPYDVELTQAMLEGAGIPCDIVRVETRAEFEAALEQGEWDLIFSDKALPEYDGLSALTLARATRPTVPFIFVSGTLGEEVAIESLKNGATDYVLKQRLKRLVPVTRRALQEAAERRERRQAQEALAAAEANLRALFAAMTDVVIVLDAQGRYLQIAPTNPALLYKPPAEFLGRTLHEVLPPAEADTILQHIRSALETQQPARVEYSLPIAGATVWFDGSISPMGPDKVIWIARDITERKRVETELRENEQRLFQFLEAVPLGLVVFDTARRPYYANQTALTLLGPGLASNVPADEITQVYPACLAGTNEIYPIERRPAPRALAGEASTADDMEIQHPDRVIPLQMWGAPIYDTAGHVAYAIAAMADITERKQAEAALRQSLERFAQAFRAIPDALSIVRAADGVIVEVNEGWPTLFGYSREEAIGRSLLELQLFDPGAREAAIARLRARGFTFIHDQELVVRRKSGELRDVLVSAEVLEMEGEQMVLTIAHDITERKRAEAELRLRAQQQATVALLGQSALTAAALDVLLVEVVTLAAAGLDAEFGALSELTSTGQSLALRSVVGWPVEFVGQRQIPLDRASQAGATLLSNHPLILDEQHPQPDFDISTYVQEQGAISAISVVVPGPVRPFGTLVIHSTRRRTFSEHDTQFLQSMANVLAAAVERERSLAAQAERDAATQANQAKSEFLSRMSHELRTPLNAILGFGQLLEMETLPPGQQESVGHILTAGHHLLALINEVLDISRIEAGNLALSIEPVLLRDILQESLELVQPSTARQRIQLYVEDLDTATPYVLADQQRLKQVLLNLLSNAIKYNRPGGQVRVSWEERPDGMLRIKVQDTGQGIAQAHLPRLFTPFDRLGAEPSGIEGTGLGLAVSQRLVEAMGGAIGVDSVVGQGSTFWLDLPLVTPPAPLLDPPAAEVGEAAPSTQGARTLLLIDDNLSNLRLIERIMEIRANIKILAAMQGTIGLELAFQHQPDLILLDLQLPDLGGAEVLQRLQSDPTTAAIPVVIFSADATPGQIQRLHTAGAFAYLTKPFKVTVLLDLVDEVLQEERLVRAGGNAE